MIDTELMLAKKILNVLSPYHRKLGEIGACGHQDNAVCFATHLEKIAKWINKGRTIKFVLPAFPAKSPNNRKTRGPFPDLGERLSLNFLNQLCKKVNTLYPPGAEIIICSDGRVFNDLVCVKDQDVGIYTQGINAILAEDHLQHIKLFGLDQHYPLLSYKAIRDRLTTQYGEPLSLIKHRVKTFAPETMLFNGIHRFIFEDQLAMENSISKNQVRLLSKEIAYRVMQRSHAWGELVKDCFPQAVRLSIHPQVCQSDKFGMLLLKSNDIWATPWHRVVLFDGQEHVLIRKKEAEAMGATPVFFNNQFSHYRIG